MHGAGVVADVHVAEAQHHSAHSIGAGICQIKHVILDKFLVQALFKFRSRLHINGTGAQDHKIDIGFLFDDQLNQAGIFFGRIHFPIAHAAHAQRVNFPIGIHIQAEKFCGGGIIAGRVPNFSLSINYRRVSDCRQQCQT